MFYDYIMNSGNGLVGNGEVAQQLIQCNFDPGLMRPYIDDNGIKCVTLNTGRTKYNEKTGSNEPVFEKVRVKDLGLNLGIYNSTSLRKDEWIALDRAVLRESRLRMRAWADLENANTFGGFNGMAKTILEHETMNDVGSANVDMDGLSGGNTNDSPRFQLEGLPLPITHSSFKIAQRRLAVSRNSGTPLDTTMAEMAGRRIGEMIERTTIGNVSGIAYGGSTGYGRAAAVTGYTNFTKRQTKADLTTPTGSNPDKTVEDILEMRDLMYAAGFYGPFMVYHSTDWDRFLDNDYYSLTTSGATAPTQTLRERIRKIEGISDIRRLDFLTSTDDPYTLIMVQMTADVARAVIGMPITNVQWETSGGLQLHYKAMCIMVPQLRSTFSDKCGILHATTS